MNLFSLLAFLEFAVSIALGIYSLRLDPRSLLNRLFVVVCASIAFWALGYTFVYPSASREVTFFWYRVSSIGWTFMPALLAHYFLVLTNWKEVWKKWWFYPLIYLPATAFLLKSLTGTLIAVDFVNGPLGNYEIHDVSTLWYLGYMMYNSVILFGCGIITWLWGRKNGTRRVRAQSQLLVLGFILSSVLIYAFNIVLPVLKIRNIPALGNLFMVVFILVIFYSIRRFRLMVLTPEIAAGEIIERMKDLMLLINPDGRIILTSRNTGELLGYQSEELVGKPLSMLFMDQFAFDTFTRTSDGGGFETIRFVSDLRTSWDAPVPVDVSMSEVTDAAGDRIGWVTVCNDLRDTLLFKKAMQELSEERNKLKKQNALFEDDLEMAKRMHMQLIPSISPDPGISFYYRPMVNVGGDFFDFIFFDDPDLVGIFISDVSGHGVPAAFITSMIKTVILQNIALMNDPASFLNYLNQILYHQSNGNFVTAFYGIFHHKNRTITYANAGHHSPNILRKGRPVSSLDTSNRGLPLAVLSRDEAKEAGKLYQNAECVIEKGARLLLYTDGVTEAVHIQQRNLDFETVHFTQILEKHSGDSSQEIIRALTESLCEFRGIDQFDDDICLVCMEIP